MKFWQEMILLWSDIEFAVEPNSCFLKFSFLLKTVS